VSATAPNVFGEDKAMLEGVAADDKSSLVFIGVNQNRSELNC
jgi:hypothetical protein